MAREIFAEISQKSLFRSDTKYVDVQELEKSKIAIKTSEILVFL